jgi:hypothetical protein
MKKRLFTFYKKKGVFHKETISRWRARAYIRAFILHEKREPKMSDLRFIKIIMIDLL